MMRMTWWWWHDGDDGMMTRWWFHIYFYFHPDPWKNDPIWRLHMFQMGWFNHQLVTRWWHDAHDAGMMVPVLAIRVCTIWRSSSCAPPWHRLRSLGDYAVGRNGLAVQVSQQVESPENHSVILSGRGKNMKMFQLFSATMICHMFMYVTWCKSEFSSSVTQGLHGFSIRQR